MKQVLVHSEPLTRQYYAPRLSFTYPFIILANLFALIVPFYFCTSTDAGIWMTNGSYREQPDVKFLYKFMMVLEATSASSGGRTKEIFVSTMDSLNVHRPESYRMANVKFHEHDDDLDGKFDSFTLEADVPLTGDEQIHAMQAVLFFDYRMQARVKFDMESVAYTSFESGLPLSGYDTRGSLELRQTNPLGIRGYFSELYSEETPLVDTTAEAATRTSESNIASLIEKYRERNVAADYVERYPIKSRATDSEENGTFHLKMKVHIPEQDVSYIPTLVEVLKDGWIKYLSVVVLFWLMLERVKRFLFREKLLPSKISLPRDFKNGMYVHKRSLLARRKSHA